MAEISLDMDDLEGDAASSAPQTAGQAPDPLAAATAHKPSLSPARNAAASATNAPKEEERQLNFGKAPLSIHTMIDDAAHNKRLTRKAFLYSLLKEHGLPIPDELLRDRRKPVD
jgi:hypothetical protein